MGSIVVPTKGVPGKKRKDRLLWHSKYGGKEGGPSVLAEGGRRILTWRQRGLSEGFYSGKERSRNTCVLQDRKTRGGWRHEGC